jgi:hypothetical protein
MSLKRLKMNFQEGLKAGRKAAKQQGINFGIIEGFKKGVDAGRKRATERKTGTGTKAFPGVSSPMQLNPGFDALPKDVQSKILKKDSGTKLKKQTTMKKESAMKMKKAEKSAMMLKKTAMKLKKESAMMMKKAAMKLKKASAMKMKMKKK